MGMEDSGNNKSQEYKRRDSLRRKVAVIFNGCWVRLTIPLLDDLTKSHKQESHFTVICKE